MKFQVEEWEGLSKEVLERAERSVRSYLEVKAEPRQPRVGEAIDRA